MVYKDSPGSREINVMLRSVAVLCGALSLAALNTSAIAQQKAVDSPLKGAWRVSEILEGPGAPDTSPFPSLYVFTDKNYSVMAVIGARPSSPPARRLTRRRSPHSMRSREIPACTK